MTFLIFDTIYMIIVSKNITNIEVSSYNNLSTLMQEIMRYNIGQRNEYIKSIIGDNHSEDCLTYTPYNVGYEIIYTNIILRRINDEMYAPVPTGTMDRNGRGNR